MQISKAGVILLTDRYEDCVAFYEEVLELPVLFRLDRADSRLTCFDLGGAYLMVEPGGPLFSHGGEAGRSPGQSPVKLRFNVEEPGSRRWSCGTRASRSSCTIMTGEPPPNSPTRMATAAPCVRFRASASESPFRKPQMRLVRSATRPFGHALEPMAFAASRAGGERSVRAAASIITLIPADS